MKDIRIVLGASIALLCACSPTEPAKGSGDVDPDTALTKIAPVPLSAYCRTESGRVIAVGVADAEMQSRLTILDKGKSTTSERQSTQSVTSIDLATGGQPPIQLRLEPSSPETGGWTPRVTSITEGGATETCLWRARTRIFALSETTAIEAFRNEAGELSLELRKANVPRSKIHTIPGGREETGEASVTMVFDQGPERYIVHAPAGESVRLARWRDGVRQSIEALPMHIVGDDPEASGSPLR